MHASERGLSRPFAAYGSTVREDAVRVPEAARRLTLDGVEVYRLLETGQLAAGRGPDGLVYVRTEAITAYLGGV